MRFNAGEKPCAGRAGWRTRRYRGLLQLVCMCRLMAYAPPSTGTWQRWRRRIASGTGSLCADFQSQVALPGDLLSRDRGVARGHLHASQAVGTQGSLQQRLEPAESFRLGAWSLGSKRQHKRLPIFHGFHSLNCVSLRDCSPLLSTAPAHCRLNAPLRPPPYKGRVRAVRSVSGGCHAPSWGESFQTRLMAS